MKKVKKTEKYDSPPNGPRRSEMHGNVQETCVACVFGVFRHILRSVGLCLDLLDPVPTAIPRTGASKFRGGVGGAEPPFPP